MPTIPNHRQISASLQVGRPDGVTWVELAPFLSSVQVELGDTSGLGTGSSGVDGVVRRMTFTLHNDGSMSPTWTDSTTRADSAVVGADSVVVGRGDGDGTLFLNLLFGSTNAWARDSFSPRDRTSSWNNVGGSYSPLLWPNREVVFRVAITTPGVDPITSDWVTLFAGYLGDNIRTSGTTLECSCRDYAKDLQDTYIETKRTYGSVIGVAVETVIQSILDDNLGGGAVTLYCPVSPNWVVKPYEPDYQTVWDAIQALTVQFGWFLGYRWDSGTGAFRLTLMEPPRTKDADTADLALSWEDDIYVQDLDITDTNVRNVVTVTYRDAADGKRKTVTRTDTTSIGEFGRRAMTIEEADASDIDTLAEATAMGDAALSDLKDLTGTSQLDLPLLPELDVFSGVVVTNPLVSSTDDFFGVSSVKHSLEWGDDGNCSFRTTAVGQGHVIGAHQRWIRMQTRPGSSGQPTRRVYYTITDDIEQALSDAASAQGTADGKIATHSATTEPAGASLGDLWFDTDDSNKLYRHDGSAWVPAQDTRIGEAVQAASDAQSTADGKVVTFYQDAEPTAEGIGDLWIDTNDDNHPHRWTGSVWQSIRDSVPIGDSRAGGITIFPKIILAGLAATWGGDAMTITYADGHSESGNRDTFYALIRSPFTVPADKRWYVWAQPVHCGPSGTPAGGFGFGSYAHNHSLTVPNGYYRTQVTLLDSGNGETTVTHNLGTTNIMVTITEPTTTATNEAGGSTTIFPSGAGGVGWYAYNSNTIKLQNGYSGSRTIWVTVMTNGGFSGNVSDATLAWTVDAQMQYQVTGSGPTTTERYWTLAPGDYDFLKCRIRYRASTGNMEGYMLLYQVIEVDTTRVWQ